MTLWQGLLSCLLLVPALENAEAEREQDANRLVDDALDAEATWRAFPGFVADLEIERDGKGCHGRVIVERDGRVFVESMPDAQRLWAVEHLDSIVRQRLAKDDAAKRTWMFVNRGTAVCQTNDPFGPCYWMQNSRFQAVEVCFARRKQRLTTLKTERNLDNKHLPTVQILHLWNRHTQELEATQTRAISWRRVSGFDLPATIQVLSAGAGAEPTTPALSRIVLTRHRLFSSTEPLFAGR